MLIIYKYKIPINDNFNFILPIDSKILTVQTQTGNPYIWVLINGSGLPSEYLESKCERRKFRLFGDDHPINKSHEDLIYLGTFQLEKDKLIFHLFEIIGG